MVTETFSSGVITHYHCLQLLLLSSSLRPQTRFLKHLKKNEEEQIRTNLHRYAISRALQVGSNDIPHCLDYQFKYFSLTIELRSLPIFGPEYWRPSSQVLDGGNIDVRFLCSGTSQEVYRSRLWGSVRTRYMCTSSSKKATVTEILRKVTSNISTYLHTRVFVSSIAVCATSHIYTRSIRASPRPFPVRDTLRFLMYVTYFV